MGGVIKVTVPSIRPGINVANVVPTGRTVWQPNVINVGQRDKGNAGNVSNNNGNGKR